MRNKISIDELVRQKVAHGEESHNLGAWANMERLLDGKNPYQEKEEKKGRPWMFLLLGAILCSTAVIGGYNYLSNHSISNSTATSVAQLPSNTSFNAQATTTPQSSNAIATSKEIDQNTTSNAVASANTTKPATIASIEKTETQGKLNQLSSNNRNNNSTISRVLPTKNTNENNTTPKIANKAKNKKDNTNLQEQALAASQEKVTSEPISKKNIAKKSNYKNDIAPTITEPYFDTTLITEVTKKFKEDEFGQKIVVSDSFKYSLIKEKKRTVINPRFVALTHEQEAAAQRRTALASNDNKIAPTSLSEIVVAKSSEIIATKSTTAKKENKSFFSLFQEAGNNLNQKAINITHTKFPIYTGMFVGVNAALINSKHNFGGFQGGFTAMTPLSRLLTLQTEARFIHKNNSGYTIKDSRNIIRNSFIDSTSVFKSKIYNYEIDSMSYGYNLQNFYTIQVPIILNANFDKFNVYAGAHLNYGFRMNVNTAVNSFAVTQADTVPIAATYQPRMNTQTKFTRDDFANRLGLGYTLGAAYNINSQLSLDLRMSNLFWDNTKGAAKQEISDVFFRIPSFQLSIGYRFRGYEKAP